MVIETALILVRALAVPVPAGLGVQDAGYILCLKALAVPDATTVGAAFVLLKRGKDLFWILLGFVLMGVSAARPRRPSPPRPGPGSRLPGPGAGKPGCRRRCPTPAPSRHRAPGSRAPPPPRRARCPPGRGRTAGRTPPRGRRRTRAPRRGRAAAPAPRRSAASPRTPPRPPRGPRTGARGRSSSPPGSARGAPATGRPRGARCGRSGRTRARRESPRPRRSAAPVGELRAAPPGRDGRSRSGRRRPCPIVGLSCLPAGFVFHCRVRLVTRPDLDGLTCAVLLSQCETVDADRARPPPGHHGPPGRHRPLRTSSRTCRITPPAGCGSTTTSSPTRSRCPRPASRAATARPRAPRASSSSTTSPAHPAPRAARGAARRDRPPRLRAALRGGRGRALGLHPARPDPRPAHRPREPAGVLRPAPARGARPRRRGGAGAPRGARARRPDARAGPGLPRGRPRPLAPRGPRAGHGLPPAGDDPGRQPLPGLHALPDGDRRGPRAVGPGAREGGRLRRPLRSSTGPRAPTSAC